MLKISAFTSASLLTLTLLSVPAKATAAPHANGTATLHETTERVIITPPDSTATSAKGFKGVQYAKVSVEKKEAPLFSGYGIYTDLAGLAMGMK